MDSRGQTGHSVIKFAEDWRTGLEDALAFEKHFIVEQYSKTDYNKRNCRTDDLYGWLARSDDYNSHGIVGEYLRKTGVLKSISDQEHERTKRIAAHFTRQKEEKNKQIQEGKLKTNRLVEEYNESTDIFIYFVSLPHMAY